MFVHMSASLQEGSSELDGAPMDNTPIDGLPLKRDPVNYLDGCPLDWDPLDGVSVDDIDGVPLGVAIDDIDGMPCEYTTQQKLISLNHKYTVSFLCLSEQLKCLQSLD